MTDQQDINDLLILYSEILYFHSFREMKIAHDAYVHSVCDPELSLLQKAALMALSGLAHCENDRAKARFAIVSLLRDPDAADLVFDPEMENVFSDKKGQVNRAKKRRDEYLTGWSREPSSKKANLHTPSDEREVLTCCICHMAECTCPDFNLSDFQ